jgi:hypothetical protein
MDQVLREDRPRERSVGQALVFGAAADESLVKILKDLLERERHPDPQAGDDQRKAQRAEMVGALSKGLKDKKSLDLALAIAEAAKVARFDADTVKLLDSIVVSSAPARDGDVIELRLLHQLAERAGKVRREDWDDELAKRIWDTEVLAERVNNRPREYRWVRGMLQDADALRHEAEIRLLPQAFGYTSPPRLARCWEEVAEAYASIDDLQSSIGEARRTVIRARATLPAYIPFQEASPELDRTVEWLDVAQNAQALDEALESSGLEAESNPLAGERLKDLKGRLTTRRQRLRTQLDELLGPFRTESVKRLIARCKEVSPVPRLGREVQALLSTPFLRPSDRRELWSISLDLERRLGEVPFRDSDPPSTGGSSDRPLAVRNLAGRRRERLAAILKIADPKATSTGLEPAASSAGRKRGANESSEAEEPPPEEEVARAWGDLRRFAREIHEKVIGALRGAERQPGEDRAAWVLPALGLDEGKNPIKLDRDRQDLAAWAWLASRYLHVYRDLQGRLDPNDKFFETASLDCPGQGRGNQEPILRPSIPDQASEALRISSQHASSDVELQIVLEGNVAGAERVMMAVLETDDARLKVSNPRPEAFDLPPATPTPIRLHVEWDESRSDGSNAPPKGLIVQARLTGGRAFHMLVPIEILPAGTKPRLALRVDPSLAVDVSPDPLRLRTLPDKQPFYVVVQNPSPVVHRVVVDVLAGDQVIATSGGKDKPAIEVKSGSTATASFGEPTGKPTDPLPKAPGKLGLRLRDAATDYVYDRQDLIPVIAPPLEYVELVKAQFIPRRPGESNRLEVTLRALAQMAIPPCPVKLDIPSDPELFPGFVEPPRGNLEGLIEPGGKPLKLFAEDIKLKPVDNDQAQFSVSVDGISRALWYQARFVPEGQAQKVELVRRSRIRFRPELIVKPGKPARLAVQFKVDNAPPDARLLFRLGHFERGEFKDDIECWRELAQKRHVGFDPRGKGGGLLFEASVEDWNREFDVPGIRGRRSLYAYLLDAREHEQLASWGMDLVLDDVAPQITRIEAPAEIESTETRLLARATVKRTEAGIKEVSFIVNPGAKGDFAKAEADNKVVPGKPSSVEPDTWEAAVQVPMGVRGKLVVSARAVSGVGLSTIAHCEVEIREPAPDPKKAAKPVEEKPGAIEGKVTENDVAQPGLMVILMNPNPKANENPVKSTVQTNRDGTYTFTDIKPGPYRVFCRKEITRREDTKDLNVGSGQTVKQDLDLLLP